MRYFTQKIENCFFLLLFTGNNKWPRKYQHPFLKRIITFHSSFFSTETRKEKTLAIRLKLWYIASIIFHLSSIQDNVSACLITKYKYFPDNNITKNKLKLIDSRWATLKTDLFCKCIEDNNLWKKLMILIEIRLNYPSVGYEIFRYLKTFCLLCSNRKVFLYNMWLTFSHGIYSFHLTFSHKRRSYFLDGSCVAKQHNIYGKTV